MELSFNIVWRLVRGDANPSLSDLPCLRSSRLLGTTARLDAIEQLAAGSLAARRINAAAQPATGRQRPAISPQNRKGQGGPCPPDTRRTTRTRPIWSHAAERTFFIATTASESSAKLPRDEAKIHAGRIERLAPA